MLYTWRDAEAANPLMNYNLNPLSPNDTSNQPWGEKRRLISEWKVNVKAKSSQRHQSTNLF
ncbi:hypothetical protein E2C01_026910 [Portunus trituberculatus]|uniref:Uncharacterized protein n=1 Tax=Portunus trituberculatus TaxID=210409 RepID=A0A5B7EJG0_PORTR|nr:hypothetical protein [Portunus trituberculatus]